MAGLGEQVADTYRSSYTYDANGNILTADRWDQSGAQYDALKYKYQGTVPPINPPTPSKLIRNRLYELYDDDVDPNDDGATEDIMAVNDPNTTPPLTPELSHDAGLNSTSNYHYDQLGNLIHDEREQIDAIQWTVVGKVKAVTRTTGSTLQPLEFAYGASGQRISKQVGGAVGDPGVSPSLARVFP
ncbi:MAG: hypothetical protein IPM68_00520 [Flavobacteriales bacterium]|nr:hypothetical protein [Flavobacteriales bacterium]